MGPLAMEPRAPAAGPGGCVSSAALLSITKSLHMNLGIAGKWALVCGASKGLGFGCAQALAREGANVVIVARGAEALQAAATAIRSDAQLPAGTQVEAIAADIT